MNYIWKSIVLVFIASCLSINAQFLGNPYFFATGGGGGGGISAPTDIANCVLWLDGSDAANIYTDSGLTTLVSADGDPVGGWKDKSTGGHNATQATSGNRPTYKTAIKNGKSVLLLDGVNDQLTVSLSLGARTIFIVARSDSTSSGAYETLLTVGGGSGFFFKVADGTGAFACNLYNGGDNLSGTSAVNSWVVFSVANDGTAGNDDLYKNASIFASVALAGSAAYDSVGGHGAEYLTGYIAEMVAFDRLLNSTEIGQMHTYLNNKWAVY
jgi:hypothetical protein